MQKPVIDISNYESFFLLYVDGELSPSAEQAVEQFLLVHPDLRLELEMLQQTLLGSDAVSYGDKLHLYRTEAAGVNLHNYEEKFLLYVDEELGDREKTEVETFVLQHPGLQDAFTLLKKTRLEPDTIVFAGKQVLYRKEEKERRIIVMNWQKLAIAAALMGVIASVWMVLTSGPSIRPAQHIAAAVGSGTAGGALTNASVQPVAAGSSANMAATIQPGGHWITEKGQNSSVAATQGLPEMANGDAVTAYNEPPAKTDGAIRIETETVSTDAPRGFGSASASPVSVHGDQSPDLIKTNLTPDGSDAEPQHAVYKELDTEDDKKSLLLGSLEINKDKLRGFFRKAGNLFHGKPKAEDEKTESPASPNTRSLK